MRMLSKAAGTVLDALTQNLPVGEARTIDNSNGTFMTVHVDRLTESTFSIAHYFGQNGDLVCDPDGVFLKTETGWLPISLQLCTGHYTVAVELDGKDKPTGFRPKALQELTSFAAMWLRNISDQQGGIVAIRGCITG